MAAALSSQELSDLIGCIYDCTLDPSRWQPTLDETRLRLDCKAGQLFLNDLRLHRSLIEKNVGIEPYWVDLQQRYASDIHARMNQWFDDGLSMDEPMVLTRQASPALLAASRYFQEWHRPQGFVDVVEITLMRSPARWSGLCFRRHESVGIFGEREAEIMRLLIPHVRRAVTISNVLDAQTVEKARMSETLDALKLGIVLADENCRILHANRAAEVMMRSCGLLRDKGGQLRAEASAASAEIRTAIGLAARNEAGIGKTGLAVRLTDDYEAPVFAHVLPLAGGEVRTRLNPEAVAAVFINTPIDEANCAQTIARTFKLTPAETRVIEPILSGKTVVEAAADIGVAMTTARTHLNNIFAKTGVSRQSELVKLAAAIAPATLSTS